MAAGVFATVPVPDSQRSGTGLLPICNLRPKVIDINCESSVMCAAQSRQGSMNRHRIPVARFCHYRAGVAASLTGILATRNHP
jgi:hypothetical protein